MSVDWDEAIEERLVAKNEGPYAKAARDMGLTVKEYEQWLEDNDQMRALAKWRAQHPDKSPWWQRLAQVLQPQPAQEDSHE